MSEDECHIQPTALFPDGANCCPRAARVTHFVDSEVGRLGTVLLHRPGRELARLTPRNNDSLLFDAIPWVGRAQEEHDAFAAALRERGVEVLYLATAARRDAGRRRGPRRADRAGAADPRLGDTLRRRVADAPRLPRPGGARRRAHRRAGARGAADQLGAAGRAGVHADGPARLRHRPAAEPAVHPRLVGVDRRPGGGDQPGHAGPPPRDHADRRDLPAPSAVRRHGVRRTGRPGAPRGRGRAAARARGAGGRRRRAHHAGRRRAAGPAGVRGVGLAHTILVVPIAQERATMHLDTVVHDGRRRRGGHVPQHRRHADRPTRWSPARTASPGSTGRRRSCGRPRTRWTSTRCGSSTPGWTR